MTKSLWVPWWSRFKWLINAVVHCLRWCGLLNVYAPRPYRPSTCGTWICDGNSHGYADTQSVKLSLSTTKQEWVVTVAKYPSFWSYFEENRELSSPDPVIQKSAVSGLQTKKRSFYKTCETSTMIPVNFSPLALVKIHGLWKRSSLVFMGTSVNVTTRYGPGG